MCMIKKLSMCLIVLLNVVACGADDQSRRNNGSVTSLNSGVLLDDLDQDSAYQLCVDGENYLAEQSGDALAWASCVTMGRAFESMEITTSSQDSSGETQNGEGDLGFKCEDVVDECMASSDADSFRSADTAHCMGADYTGCMVTVGQFEVCMRDAATYLNELAEGLSCSSELDDVQTGDWRQNIPSCARIFASCGSFGQMDDSGEEVELEGDYWGDDDWPLVWGRNLRCEDRTCRLGLVLMGAEMGTAESAPSARRVTYEVVKRTPSGTLIREVHELYGRLVTDSGNPFYQWSVELEMGTDTVFSSDELLARELTTTKVTIYRNAGPVECEVQGVSPAIFEGQGCVLN